MVAMVTEKSPRVAVIGAGISGVAAAAHLLRENQDVVLFERSGVAGGVWQFDARCALEPPYPNERPPPSTHSRSQVPSSPGAKDIETEYLVHAPPGPCYAGLRNNVPTSLMRSVLMEWPENTDEIVGHEHLARYIQDLAERTAVRRRTIFDTTVEDVWKPPGSPTWNVLTRSIKPRGAVADFVQNQWQFDAVVVASGHYHEPLVPDITGLGSWKKQFPESIIHSKRYRCPEPYRDKTVLLVGGGVSSHDIARELHGVARKVYVSSRGGQFDLAAPDTAITVGGLDEIVVAEQERTFCTKTRTLGAIVTKDGTRLEDVDQIILATGYLTSYPFLRDLQRPEARSNTSDDRIIVTGDGMLTHNLHKDIWYIPDPTLSFVGVPFHVSTFSLFDFQGEVAARVQAGKARLPTEMEMRRDYSSRKASMSGSLRSFHSLFGKEVSYMDELRQWINEEACTLGHDEMRAMDEKWLARHTQFFAVAAARQEAAKAAREG